ncbi:bile acid:sodium symporter family protein [Marinibaculum pumilum]|uniref:Bile acid:sodium symporter family protein n=1 Tax=Marinibaculum pumilum TaxID=1766165 RepID=A0ABV7L8C9_9PROT
MEALLTVILPVSLAVIMFALGIGLTLDDFARVARRPFVFLAGAVAQLAVLPLIAFALVGAFGMQGALAVGVMILAFCPGGVTSSVLTRLARGDVALSISLTAVLSLVSLVTIPLLVALTVGHFMAEAAPDVDISSLTLSIFLISTVPVAVGVGLRRLAPHLADRIERVLRPLALLLFLCIVLGAIAANWQALIDHVLQLGPVLVALNVAVLLVGLGVGRVFGLRHGIGRAMAIELGTQNATLGITLGALIATTGGVFSGYALPSAVYGVTMYLVMAPFVAWWRWRTRSAA